MYQIPPPTKPLAEMSTDSKQRNYPWADLVRMIGNPIRCLTDDEYQQAHARLNADNTDLFTDGQHYYTIGTYNQGWALFGVRMGKRLVHAQVRLTDCRQVELDVDVTNTPAEIRLMAIALAKKEYGDADIVEVEQIEEAAV